MNELLNCSVLWHNLTWAVWESVKINIHTHWRCSTHFHLRGRHHYITDTPSVHHLCFISQLKMIKMLLQNCNQCKATKFQDSGSFLKFGHLFAIVTQYENYSILLQRELAQMCFLFDLKCNIKLTTQLLHNTLCLCGLPLFIIYFHCIRKRCSVCLLKLHLCFTGKNERNMRSKWQEG